MNEEPQNGPDGWPYLLVRTSAEAAEPFARVVEWLAGRGIGLVVNPHKMVPDYVFTYGMLWNYIETGRFVLPSRRNRRARSFSDPIPSWARLLLNICRSMCAAFCASS